MKISIHGHSPPILGILPILLVTFLTLENAVGLNLREIRVVSLLLDISGSLPEQIDAVAHDGSLNNIKYVVKNQYLRSHVIGDVVDGDHKIINDHGTNAERCVIVSTLEDGSKFVKVTTLYESEEMVNEYNPQEGDDPVRVVEFMKKPTDPMYLRVSRTFFDIDLLKQRTNNLVSVRSHELVLPGENSDETTILEDGHVPPITYSVRPEVKPYVTIGAVKFGDYIVDDVDGLLERTVVWERGIFETIVTVVSKYNNGEEVEEKFEYTPNEGGNANGAF